MTSLLAGRYRLDQRIGAGAMGQVWRAVDERLGREVAVKTIDLRAVTDPTLIERFRREAIATARLSHPAIVTIFDSGTDGDTAYLVMELLPGENVSQLVRREGSLPVERAVHIAATVARALDAAHEVGIVHRDIKPGNVMVSGDTVTLLDFGIATLITDAAQATLTQPATTIGTAAYMSPEQARGERPTPASDVYSLGCLLMTMLTGAPPFIADNPIAVAHAQIADVPPRVASRRPEVPWEIDDLVRRMLAKDPSARPSAKAVVGRLAGGAALADPPTTVLAPPAEPGTRVMPAMAPPAGVPMGAAGPGVGAGVGSASRMPVGPGTAPPAPPPSNQWFGRGIKIIAVVIALLLLGLVVYAGVNRLLATWNPFAPAATPSPSASAKQRTTPSPVKSRSASPTPTPTQTQPRQTIPIPSLPSIPSGPDVAAQAAMIAMQAALEGLPAGTEEAEKAREDLLDAWDDAVDSIRDGEAAKGLTKFAKELDKQHKKGGISEAEYVGLRVALEAVQAVV